MSCILGVVNYNTPELVYNLQASFREYHPEIPVLILDNSKDEVSSDFFIRHDLAFTVSPGPETDHGSGVRTLMRAAPERYLILCDSDVEFTRSIVPVLELAADNALVGQYVDDIYRTRNDRPEIIAKRIDPAFCVIDLDAVRQFGLYFNSDSRSTAEDKEHPCLRDNVIYDTGSQLLEGAKQAGLPVSTINIKDYALHYGRLTRRPALAEEIVERIKVKYGLDV